MSEVSEKIAIAVQMLAKTHLVDMPSFVYGTVEAVDESKHTCDVLPIGGNADTLIPAVKLTAEDNDGWLLIPAIGSTVVVVYSTRQEPFIAFYSTITSAILITTDAINLQGNEYGGLVKVVDLVTKINRLENKLNDLITKYDLHTHAGVTAGGAITAVPSVTETVIAPLTTRANIENTKVNHGS